MPWISSAIHIIYDTLISNKRKEKRELLIEITNEQEFDGGIRAR